MSSSDTAKMIVDQFSPYNDLLMRYRHALEQCASPLGQYRMDNAWGQDALMREARRRIEIAARALGEGK